MTTPRVPAAAFAVAIVYLMANRVTAQNPKPPTPLPPDIQSVEQLPRDAIVLWIDGQNLTVYIDTTSEPDNQNKITSLEIKWDGPGPGFVEENCDFENIYKGHFDVCHNNRIAKIAAPGIGPVYDLGNVIPEGYLSSWNPADAWIADSSKLINGWDKFCSDCPYFGPVPEPSTLTPLVIGLVLCLRVQHSLNAVDATSMCRARDRTACLLIPRRGTARIHVGDGMMRHSFAMVQKRLIRRI